MAMLLPQTTNGFKTKASVVNAESASLGGVRGAPVLCGSFSIPGCLGLTNRPYQGKPECFHNCCQEGESHYPEVTHVTPAPISSATASCMATSNTTEERAVGRR